MQDTPTTAPTRARSKFAHRLRIILSNNALLLLSRVAALGPFKSDADGVPIPPKHLIFLVTGGFDFNSFLTFGKIGAETLRDTLRKNAIEIEKFESILDFGCGIGRVLRHLPMLTGSKLFGCDYNRKLIAWCQDNLPFAKFSANQLLGKLPYDDHSFDFIYALSVFTHLTEAQHTFWINELRRILRPGGYLFLTTHGQSYEHHIPANLKEQYRRGKLVVLNAGQAGKNRCAAFHPDKYVRNELARGWQVIDFVKEGALGNPRQDVYLLRKP